MTKFILLDGGYLASVDGIECYRHLADDWYLDDSGKNRQWFCELTKVSIRGSAFEVYNHVFEKFISALEEGMKSGEPIIKPPLATSEDWE